MMTMSDAVLRDKSPFGGERHWAYYKAMNLKLSDYLRQCREYKLSDKLKECSTYLEFKRNPNTGYLHLYRTYYCHNKLCYLCNWRKSLKEFHQLKNILAEANEQEPNCRFIFLTLTEKSATQHNLNQKIRELNHNVSKLLAYAKVKKFMVGYVRSTEVTVNDAVKADEIRYHHHVHAILMVKNYFSKGNYMKQEEWTELWKQAIKVDYTPIINVQAIKANKKKHLNAVESASRELSKYVVKPASYLADEDDGFDSQDDADEHNINVINCLLKQLKGLRRTSYGGLLRKVRSKLYGSSNDDEDDDLTHISDDDSRQFDSATAETVVAYWNQFKDDYYIKK